MAEATIRANAPLPDMARGEVATVDVDDRLLRRAAGGLVTILVADGVEAANADAALVAGTIDDVMDRVGDDPDAARRAWDAEHQRDGGARVGLISRLEAVLGGVA